MNNAGLKQYARFEHTRQDVSVLQATLETHTKYAGNLNV